MSRNEKQVVIAPTAEVVNPTRRGLLRAAGVAGSAALAAPFLALSGRSWAQESSKPSGKLTPLNFAWNQASSCLSPVAVAKETGIFEKNGLDVELTNYSGSTDQLLEALATGKSDAAVGMIHRWLKPLESGFDVKIVAGLHGGCMRLLGYKPAGVTKIEDLHGKAIGVLGQDSPSKHFFTVYLQRYGIDAEREITWKVYPRDLLGLAAEKGEIQAIADTDPLIFLLERDAKGNLVELASNTSSPYEDKLCCVVGVGGKLVRDRRPVAGALVKSLVDAYDWARTHQEESAKIFQKYTTNISVDELKLLYKNLTLHHHQVGTDLRDQIAYYANDFKGLGVLKATTDVDKYADHVFAKVL